ncbi:MAG TPA: FtsK/SpoIIIE domain-containing protein, partial [Chthoniobacteraceae bacterium]|nr:FtsK/SpoIIIE domain-containing protein [Chthoniobacteraceae bacterium]
MSSPFLTARETLALLARLKTLVAQIAEAEVRSLSEVQKRRVAMERKYRDATIRARTAEETFAETDARQWAEYQERLQAHQAARRVRIQALYRQSLRKLDTLAQRKKEKFLGDLQMRHFRAERQKPKETKQLEKEFATVSAELGGHEARIKDLIARTDRALGGVSALRQFFETAAPVDLESAPPLGEQVPALEESVAALEQFPLVRGLRYVPPPYLYGAAALFGLVIAFLLGEMTGAIAGGGLALVMCGLVFIVQHTATGQARDPAAALAPALTLAKATVEQALQNATAAHEERMAALEQRFAAEYADIEGQWGNGDEFARKFVVKQREKLETQVLRLMRRNEEFLAPRIAGAQVAHQARGESTLARMAAERTQREAAHAAEHTTLSEEENVRWAPIETRWREEVLPVYQEVLDARSAGASKGPANLAAVEQWRPPAEFTSSIEFGRLALDLAEPATGYPRDPRLQLPGPVRLELPVSLVFPEQGSLLFETKDSGEKTVIDTLNNVILRFLACVPAGKLSVTVIDPVGLGQNFAGLMTLGDYEESLINRRIWTQREQIDERLAELNEHIEKMIQMYLRDEFATISEYNAKAGSVAEKYHLLVVADFPAGFSETAAKRIQSIAASGPRCGVFTLIHWDTRHIQPDGLVPEELRKRAVCIRRDGAAYVMNPKENPAGATLLLDPPPEPAVAAALVHKIGKSSIDSNRVEVPFSQISPPATELWQSETTQELRVPIGRTGATKLQYLSIGKGTRQHALFAGKTGSGKSTLFHVIITNLALWCSPEQVE